MAESKNRKIESRQFNRKEKDIISSKISQDYQKLARELNFEKPEIENIQHICNGKDLSEYCMEIITRWEAREGHQASKERMIQALTNIQRQDIVDQLCNEREHLSILDLAMKSMLHINFNNWRLFGISLGLSDYELDDIDLRNVRQIPDIFEVCYQLLCHWKQKYPDQFGEKFLFDKLEELNAYEETQVPVTIGLINVVSLICGDYAESLAKELLIDPSKEKDIAFLDYENNPYEFCYQVLKTWKIKNGKQASVGRLLSVLRNITEPEIVNKIIAKNEQIHLRKDWIPRFILTNLQDKERLNLAIKFISYRIDSCDYKNLGRRLGINDAILADVERKCIDEGQNFQQVASQILAKWGEISGETADAKDLIRALTEIQRLDIINEMRAKFYINDDVNDLGIGEDAPFSWIKNVCFRLKNDVKKLARALKISDWIIDKMERKSYDNSAYFACLVLEEWRQKMKSDHLQLQTEIVYRLDFIDRHDLVDLISNEILDFDHLSQQNIPDISDDPKGQLNIKEKTIISSKIAQDFRKFAKELSFEEQEIDNIEHKCDSNGRNNPEKYCMEIITRWEQREKTRASKERIKQLLTNIQRQDIVDQLCDKKDVIPVSQKQELLQKQKEIQSKLESAQLEAYKGIEMEIAPWMTGTYLPLKELYVELQMFSADKLGNEDNGVFIDIDEIFNPTEGNTQPRRILVEGDAGFGKTTLLNKLVDDWTKRKDYIYHKFRNVFLFYLREFHKDQSFEDLIKIECKELDVNEEKGLKCVKTFEKKALFLLDGYDELSENSKSKFENLFLREKFKHSTVIVTSRRDEFQTQNKKKISPGLSDKHGTRKDNIYIWDKRILISGISVENRIKFLEKYLQIKNINKSLGQHFQIADKELFRCPLFLILLATVKDEENVQLIDTQTDFYKFLLSVVTKRSLVTNHELDKNENIELFDSNHENYNEECAKQMDLFGSLAIQHLITDDLTFTQEEIEECCGKDAIFTKLGFINRRMTYKNWNRKNYFEPFHKSFLEFFAAFSLYRLATKSEESDQEEFKKKISDLVHGNIISNGTSLIYPFLAGLLNTGSSLLFDALSPWGSLMNIFDTSFLKILIETKTPETLISSLVPFIPPILNINRYFSGNKYYTTLEGFFHKLFSSSFKFHTVEMNYPCPFQIRTKNYKLNLFNRLCIKTQEQLSVVECENLVFTLEKIQTNVWQNVIKIFLQTKFKTLAIKLNRSIDLIPLLHKELFEGFWKKLDIDELTIEDEICFLNSQKTYTCLFELVQNNRIKDIKFLGNCVKTQVITNKILNFLDWECLDQISIKHQPENANPVIPFSILCQSLKKWKTIRFGNLFDYSLTDSSVFCSVEEITLDEYLDKESCEFVLKHCTGFTTLKCDNQLLNTCLSIRRLSTLQDLRLTFYKNKNFDWTKLLVLTRLRSLSIKAYGYQQCDVANSLTFFVCQSQLEILNLDFKTESMLLNLQNVYLGIEKQEMNKTKIHSIDSEKNMNQNKCSSNLKSLKIKFGYSTDSLTEEKEIISLCKQILKKHFVSEIILKYFAWNQIEFIQSLLVSLVSEGFLLSRDKLDNVLLPHDREDLIIKISLDPKLN